MQKNLLTLVLCFLGLAVQAQLTAPSQDHILRFSNSAVFAPIDPKLNLGSEFTMAAWVYPTARQPYGFIMGKPNTDRSADPYMTYMLGWDSNGDKVEFVQTTGAAGTYNAIMSPEAIPLNSWTHVAATLGNGTMRLYVNGQLVGSMASPGAPQVNNVPFGIGGGVDKGNYCCGSNAYIKQAGVWNKVLTATEIAGVAQAIPAPSATGLVAFWKLDEGSGQVAQDLSNNQLHATLGTAPTTDNNDPVWVDNFYFSNEPFFNVKATTISPALPHALEDMYPFDINQDGRVEFITVSISWPPTPYPGTFRPFQVLGTNADLTVSNQTSTYFKEAVQMVHPRHMAMADFDNNGKMDIIAIGHGTDVHPFPGEQSLLLFGQADGSLKNVTATNLPQAIDFTHHVSIGDIDGDGDIDIYMANIGGGHNSPRFYLNNGSGVFTVGTNNLPAQVSDKSNGVYTSSALADLDGDGDLDLFLGGDERTPSNLVLLNNGSGIFTIKQHAADKKLLAANWITIALSVADFDGDGDLDVITSNTPGEPFYKGAFLQLLLNDGKGNFTDASDRITQQFSSEGWVKWVDATDLNNDGILDLVLSSNGGTNNSIFIGVGNARFKQAPIMLPPSDGPLRATDVDGDGDQDLVSVAGNTAYVAENVQPLALSTAPLNILGTINLCEGSTDGPLLSTTSNPNYTYTWLKDDQPIENATTSSYKVTAPGKYQVVTKNLDYPSITSLAATVVTAALPVATISQSGNLLTASEGTSYKWYKDEVLLNHTARTYTPTVPGNYKVEVSNAAGCSALSQSYAITLTALQEEIIVKHTQVFPNPTASKVNVQAGGPYVGKITASLVNSNGKVLQKKQLKKSGDLDFSFEVGKYAGQLFYILLETETGVTSFKVLKQER
ncbi:FG-GAP-like repeat-containing protein [Pontibacter sp. H249]|uniref:FG-GAP-like repeat-containing protein n=1 Tax=Pontibacter sp. H249 TaxID=3133420 RepID=UPI0030BE6636